MTVHHVDAGSISAGLGDPQIQINTEGFGVLLVEN